MSDSDAGADVTDEAILTVFAETDAGPLYAWEVADDLPADDDVVGDQLADLAERGLVESDDDFAPGTVWRVPDDADLAAAIDGDEDAATGERDATDETDVEAQATGGRTTAPPLEHETVESPPPAPGEDVAWHEYEPPTDPIASFDPPGNPDQKGQRREALRHAYGYLREHEPLGRDALVEAVFPDYPGAYEEPDDGWWDEVIEPGLASLPDVERFEDGTWGVTGTDAGPPGETL